MAGWLSATREGVKTALTREGDSWTTWDYSPERIPVPAIALTYGNPLLEDGGTFADLQVRFVVTLVPETGMNESVTDALDALIETSVLRLIEAEYGVEQVGQPYVLEANNARYLAVDITVTTDVQPYEGDDS